MAETLQTGAVRNTQLVRAVQIAHDTPVRQSPNGVRFATFGETGLADLDLDRMIEAVPAAVVASLNANTYYFVPLTIREASQDIATAEDITAATSTAEPAMVASAWTDELSESAICHRNVELPHGKRGVFISTRLMGDRFALSFEFFINVAHAFVDQAGVPAAFADLAWQQALANTRGETSLDAWEARNLAFGRPANYQPDPEPTSSRRGRPLGFSARQRSFSSETQRSFTSETQRSFSAAAEPAPASTIDEKERTAYLDAAFSDAVAIYLLSLALDFDYNELRERDYPLLAPQALAARLKLVADLFPPNPTYDFAVKYRRRA
jgi:hypothetical protein